MAKQYALFLLITLLLGLVANGAENDNEKLYAAIRTNDLRNLAALLDQGANANAADGRKVTPLMDAAAIGSVEAMKALVGHGANVNAQNALGFTALMWSVPDLQKVRLLLDNGADVNLKNGLGQTALLMASGTEPSIELVRTLLAKGADLKTADGRGFTALHAAAFGGDVDTIALLLDKGLDVNAAITPIGGGLTPLMLAAVGRHTQAAQLLLARGANVNAITPREPSQRVKNGFIDAGGNTALMLASAYVPPELVKTLLDAGADINVKDVRGMTALMFSVATDHQNPEIIRILLARGADTNIKSRLGETAMDWARKTGAAAGIQALGGTVTKPTAHQASSASAPDLKTAISRSNKLLETTAASFLNSGGCFACHAQPAAQLALTAAGRKGMSSDETTRKQIQQIIKSVLDSSTSNGGGGEATLYSIEALRATGDIPERTKDYVALALASQQQGDGSWHGTVPRTPMQDGDFTLTGLSVRALAAFSAPSMKTDAIRRIDKAKQWLLHAQPVTIENRAMRMLGLAAAGINASEIRKAAQSILERQRADGGWGQRDELSSDAYATGMALWALADAGMLKPADAAYQKGVRFLLSTQAEDGSWHVASRAAKFQPYFESGFPYGHDQWISSMATGWAATALALALE